MSRTDGPARDDCHQFIWSLLPFNGFLRARFSRLLACEKKESENADLLCSAQNSVVLVGLCIFKTTLWSCHTAEYSLFLEGQMQRLKRRGPASYWLFLSEMQFDIQYLPTVMPGCYMDGGLFQERHEKPFIINVIESTWCMDVISVHRFL